MNKSTIQHFAIWARREMIAQVSQRAYQYGITEAGYGDANTVAVAGRVLTPDEQSQRRELVQLIRRKGYTQVMEEVAYTWFNRFIALRYMEVNNYLPSHVRVFSDSTGAFKPEILSDVIHLDLPGLDQTRVTELIEKNQTEDLYRYLLLTQCNALNEALPRMFQRMGGYTELLLPNNILKAEGILGRMVADIPEADWTDQVQIIGWLYQYYNSELKDDTFALLKKNVKISRERIPSATQLFTPDWIVRYMVENSLGRLWLEGHPDAGLQENWKYYQPEAAQEAGVRTQLEKLRAEHARLEPADLKVIDPCMGSGHILVYAFDVLMQIYESAGWSQRDAARSILEHNLYGLDIDDRAAQLAYFAVMMKARQYDRRIFSRGIQPHVYAIAESNDLDSGAAEYFTGGDPGLKKALGTLTEELRDAKEYGSILNITPVDFAALKARLEEVAGDISMYRDLALAQIGPLVRVAEVMAGRYHVVCTNPPYMGSGGMSAKLSKFVKDQYPLSKADMFACFIEKCARMTRRLSYVSMVTMQSWMFLSSFEKFRTYLLERYTITDLLHMENMVMGIAFGTSAFVMRNQALPALKGTYHYVKMADIDDDKPRCFPVPGNRFAQVPATMYHQIPGTPVAYWVSDNFVNAYGHAMLSDTGFARSGLQTGNNDLYLKLWFEVSDRKIAYNMKSKSEFLQSGKKWTSQIKGGSYRKWYGNFDYVVNWEHDGYEIRRCDGCRLNALANEELFFRAGITWSHTTSGGFGARYLPAGHLFNVEAPTFFPEQADPMYVLGMLNSCVAQHYLNAINSTVHYLVGNISALPIIRDDRYLDAVRKLVADNIAIARADWDAFETSWDFSRHPLVLYAPFTPAGIRKEQAQGYQVLNTLADAYRHWEQACEDRFSRLKANEEALNRIFIDIYGLQQELSAEVADKDVTVRRADPGRDIRSLISYAVGCMFGRYSLDTDGLAYAGGAWEADKYRAWIPDEDNIIPICDDDYFDDDITGRFVRWVETVYGGQTLEENLKFIADALGGKGTPREVIRSYFLNEFFADHCADYQVTGAGKRPIYWLFDSGKKNGFKALVYMHRYRPDLLARMRTGYVHEMQERYRTQLAHLAEAINSASGARRVKLTKQQKKVQDQTLEIQKYEEKIHHLADQNISIDLDDGVKHNYALFADVLAKIK